MKDLLGGWALRALHGLALAACRLQPQFESAFGPQGPPRTALTWWPCGPCKERWALHKKMLMSCACGRRVAFRGAGRVGGGVEQDRNGRCCSRVGQDSGAGRRHAGHCMFVLQIVHAYVEFICDTGISSVHHTWNMHALRVAIQVLRTV